MTNAAIIICTRPQSSRLPGKVFMQVAGHMAIQHIIERLRGCGIPVVLAVPGDCDEYDHIIRAYERETDIKLGIFYGNGPSPLHRMADCAEAMPEAEWIVRITHDDIVIDQKTMLDVLKACQEKLNCGYGISPAIVDGAGVEVIHRDNLLHAARERKEPTEFISYFVKDFPRPKTVVVEPRQSIRRPYRLTMDYYEDWIVLDTVLSQVGHDASLDLICHYLDTHPYISLWNRQPLVTYYTCVKNGEKYLRAAMKSVLSNNGIDFEYIVVDDGSNDQTAVIVSEFSADKRVRFFKNEKSIGLASSSNIAINKARGKYIMRVDADDIIMPHATKAMIAMISDNRAGAIYAAYQEINASGEIISDDLDPQDVHHAGCALFDHKMINEIRFTEGLRHFDGADLHKRMAARNMMIGYIDKPMWLYRRHEKNHSNSDHAERARVRTALDIGNATATSILPK